MGWPLFAAAVAGALLISLLARWAPLIRGHGIPEAMEAVLTKQSRVAPRTAIAKPISAAIAIGTGAPFGAEGPIIVTGGSIGSLLGQVIRVSPSERKILLAAGAAAGMSATFGAPLGGGGARHRAAALRVLRPGVRPARRGHRHRRRHALRALRRRAALPGARPRLRRPRRAAGVRPPRSRVRRARHRHHPRPVRRRGPVPAAARRRLLAPRHRCGRLRHGRPPRAARTRGGLRRHR